MNKLKKVFKIFILFSVLLIQIFSGIEKPIIKAQGERDAAERYGITNVKLKDFNYYERTIYHEGAGSHYHWYGSAFDFDFALPANVKKGEYFTLTLPPELILSNLPMYTNSETVPYDRLDEQPNKYGRPGMQNDNVFFTIKDKAANNVILKVYYTKENELTFVVQEAAENKGPITGSGTVGDPVDLNELKAYTGIAKRKYLPGNQATNDNSTVSEEQVTSFPKLWEGIRPNKELLRPQAGSTANYKGIQAANTKPITFKTRYKNYTEFNINSTANINYSTELSKTWKDGNNALVYNDFGKESFQVIKEDKDYLYFGFYYMSNKGVNRRPNERNSGKSYEIYGRNQRHGIYGAPASTTLFPINKQYLILDRNSIVINKVNRNTPAQAHVPDTVGNPIRVTPPATGYSNKASGRADGFNGTIEFERAQHNNQNSEFVRFNFNDNTEPHYITFRMRKNETNAYGNYLLASHITGSTGGFRRYAETYERTMGFASAEVEPETPPFLAQPSLKLMKTDTNGKILTRKSNEPSPVEFKATDEETGIEFIHEMKENGEIEFPSLIRNHTYILEETKANQPFELSTEKYRIRVDDQAKIKIFKLNADKSDGPVVGKYTKPLAIADANDARFTFSNSSSIFLKIKKVDSSNKIISGSKAEFLLYRPGNYSLSGNNVNQTGQTRPDSLETVFNGRFGESNTVEIAPSETPYILKEAKAPNGAKLLDHLIKFKVKEDGSIEFLEGTNRDVVASRDGFTHTLTISNEKTTKVIIDKHDLDNRNTKLRDAEFELTNNVGNSFNPVIKKRTTPDGKLEFDNLAPGVYYIKEKVAPDGYSLIDYDIKVTVAPDLNVSVENVPKNTVRTSFRSVGDSAFNTLGRTAFFSNPVFRSAFRTVGENRSANPMPQPPYYKDPDPNTNTQDKTLAKQTITEVSPGRYKVDVEVNAVNRDLDVVFVVQGARYENTVANNREIIKNAFEEIKKIADNNGIKANVTVYEDGSPTSNNYKNILVNYMDVNEAIKTQAYNNVKASLNPDNFNGIRNSVETIFNAAIENKDRPVRNKLLIQILERGLWSDEKNNVSANSERLSKATSAFKHYIVWGNANRSDNRYWDPAQVYPNNPRGDKVDRTNTAAYSEKVNDFIKNNVLDLNTGNISINLNNNVRFDGFENVPSDTNAQNSGQSITVTGIKHTGYQPYRFSYYVRSNSETANLNTFEDINSTAVYKPLSEKTSDQGINIPTPKILNPGINITVNKGYTPKVPAGLKADSTLSLLKNDTIIPLEIINLKEGSHTFRSVPKYDNNGNEILYKITDTNIQNNLVSTINPGTVRGSDSTITVTHDLKPLSIKVKKEWKNTEEERKEDIKVRLEAYVDNTKVDNLSTLAITNVEKTIPKGTSEIIFDNLPRRTNDGKEISYSIVELKSDGSSVDPNDVSVEYNYGAEGDNEVVTITNDKYKMISVPNKRFNKNDIQIIKVDKDNTNKELNANFKISRDSAGNTDAQDRNSKEIFNSPDTRGYADGLYYLKENSVQAGYTPIGEAIPFYIKTKNGEINVTIPAKLQDGNPVIGSDGLAEKDTSSPYRDYFEVSIDKNYQHQPKKLIKITAKNKQKKYPIKIVKIKANGEKITNSDTRFVIKSADTNGESDIVNIGGNQSATFSGEYTFNPGNAGNEGFPPGIYYIREITAPNGYKLLNRNIKVEITEQGGVKVDNQDITVDRELNNNDLKVSYDNNGLITLQVKNKKLFNLHIKKRVKSEVNALGTITSSDQLDGNLERSLRAVFNLEKENGNSNWGIVQQGIATENGYASIQNLEEGKYRLVETTAPNGYIRLNNPVEFTVNSSGVITLNSSENDAVAFSHNNSTMELVVAVKNEPIKYNLKLIKSSSSDANTKIADAGFTLYRDAQTTDIVQAEKRTASGTGEVEFTELLPGRYYIKETTTPQGYIANEKVYEVNISGNGDVTLANSGDNAGDDKFVLGNKADNTTTINVKNDSIKEYKFKIRKFPMYMPNNAEITENELVNSNLITNTQFSSARIGFYKIEDSNVNTGIVSVYRGQITNLPSGEYTLGQSNNKLVAGTYYLSEDRSPNDYLQIPGAFKFDIRETGHIEISYTEDVERGNIADQNNVPNGLKKVLPNATYTRLIVLNRDGTVQNNPDNLNSPEYVKYSKYISISKDATDNNILNVNVKNDKVKFKLKKKSSLGDVKLEGAEFQLYEGETGDVKVGPKQTTNKDGIIEFTNLKASTTYRLKEIKAPKKHKLNAKDYLLQIDRDGNIQITNADDKISIAPPSNTNNNIAEITVINELPKSEYPATGGFGTIVTTALGLFIAGISSIMIYRRKRQN